MTNRTWAVLGFSEGGHADLGTRWVPPAAGSTPLAPIIGKPRLPP
ncbi:hypothetical protein [Nocardia brasiliensis]